MKKLFVAAALGLAVAGCDQGPKSGSGSGSASDNTAVNVRDRDSAAKTPIDQNENKKDIDITAEIRKRVVDTKMSVAAQNVKIITQDGKVTLRGPVKTADEKAQIEKFAQEVAGATNVDSQIEIEPAN
jgi:hyperosmotically inducible protein